MPSPVNYNDRILVVGKTGSGKTVFARRLFASMGGARRFAIDPKGRLSLGVEPTRHVELIDGAAPVVHYVPSRLDEAEYAALYQAILELGGPTIVWLDEAHGPTKAGYAPLHMRIAIQQGRELGIGHFACAQRPVNIAAELRTEAEHVFMFVPPPHRLDLDSLSLELGVTAPALAEQMRELQEAEGDYSFLWYERQSGELAPCAPVPLEEGPIVAPAAEEEGPPEGDPTAPEPPTEAQPSPSGAADPGD